MSLRRSARGSTLVQVAAAVAAVGVLATAAIPLAFRLRQAAEEQELSERLLRLERALISFYRDHARFPTGSEGLAALTTAPTGDVKWRGPYLTRQDSWRSLVDPRGGSIAYAVSGSTVTLSSAVWANQTRTVSSARVDQEWIVRTKQKLSSVRAALLAFNTSYSGLPANLGGVVRSTLGGDYALDPWGQPIQLNTATGQLQSYGPDLTANSSDDIYLSVGVTGVASGGSGGSGWLPTETGYLLSGSLYQPPTTGILRPPQPFVLTPSGSRLSALFGYYNLYSTYSGQLSSYVSYKTILGSANAERYWNRYGVAQYYYTRYSGVLSDVFSHGW